MKNNEHFLGEDIWNTWIGLNVSKYFGKPFKNGSKIGRVISIKTNPLSNKIAFEMEDDILVDCFRCYLLKDVLY